MSRRQHTFLIPLIGFGRFAEMWQRFRGLLCKDTRFIIGDLVSFAVTIGSTIIAVLSIGELHEGLTDLPADYLEGGIKRPLHTLFPGLLPQILILYLTHNPLTSFHTLISLHDSLTLIYREWSIVLPYRKPVDVSGWTIREVGCEGATIRCFY